MPEGLEDFMFTIIYTFIGKRLTSDFGIDVYSGHYLSSGRLGRFGPTHFNLEEKRASPTVAQIEPAE